MPEPISDVNTFQEAIKAPNLSVVHFDADWVDQCGQVNDVLDTISKQNDYTTVKFFKCPAETLSELSLKYKIEAVPTVVLFQNGREIDRVNGANVGKLTETIKQNLGSNQGTKETLEERLKRLINRSKVMLFMKGDRSAPRCGFSKTIIGILNETGASYDTFDILTDEEVRQGLKTYSDWPTYPQLYVNGELVGGLDIVKELLASGELNSALTG